MVFVGWVDVRKPNYTLIYIKFASNLFVVGTLVPFLAVLTSTLSAYYEPVYLSLLQTEMILPITHYQLPITNYQLPITHYPLPITHYPLLNPRLQPHSDLKTLRR